MALDERGHSLAECLCRKASAACTARRLLHDLLGRINELNASLHFLARVKRAIVFGSFLSNVDRLGDVDVAIEWERREKDWDKHHQANNERVAEEVRKGATLRTWSTNSTGGGEKPSSSCGIVSAA
jgi:predicted nucleotidyltransferase